MFRYNTIPLTSKPTQANRNTANAIDHTIINTVLGQNDFKSAMITTDFSDPKTKNQHCMKIVQIRSFFWSVFSRIWTEYSVQIRKIRTRKNSVFGHFSRSAKTKGKLYLQK